MKACGNHADDGIALSVQRHALADDVARRTKLPAPQAFGDQCHRGRADFIFPRRKGAAEKWFRTKYREEVGRDELAGHLLGFPASSQAERRTTPHCHCSECVVALPPVTKIQIRDRSEIEVRFALTQRDELFR